MNLLRIVLRQWKTVLLLALLGGLAGVLYTQFSTPIFVADAELEMSVRRPRVINNDAVFEDNNGGRDADAIFNTRFAKFKSPAMERLAAQEFLKQRPEKTTSKSGSEIGPYTLASWIQHVSWYKDPSANIVHVSFENSDPEFAAKLVNVLTYCAGVLMIQENQALSDEAVKWLITQADEQRDSLEEVERQLANIRNELRLDSLEQRKAALGQSLVSVSQEKETLISKLASRKTIYNFISGLKDTDPNLEMLPSGLPKEEQLNELILAWRTANNELLNIADRYTDIHPEYRKAAENERRARGRLEQFIDLASKSVLNEIDLLEKQVKQVDERIDTVKSEALELDQLLESGTQRLQSLERKRDAADDAYQTMLKRMEEARLSADENMAYTKVIREASVPRIPVRPRKIRAIALSVFLGVLAGSVLSILIAFWTDKIASVNDLKALKLNILGTIPSQKKMISREDLATIGLRDRFSHIVEIFAGINALISSGKYVDLTKVILISSVMPGEGKTVSACNLAISSALNGSRTLLIDADLRRPQLVNVFGISAEHPSLLEWLSNGENSFRHDQLVSAGIIENLDVITSRHLQDINPAELLGRGRLAELINWAREHYDRVIIDSPPLGPVGDAHVLANQSDSIIMVSRIGKTRRRGLKFALARFNEIDAYVLGCIANDVPHSLSGLFGGAEGYGYGYGYGGNYKSYGQDDG
ncbi:MAG: polysaccharide biosynthesis tyrosine autokinase [Kiritimatiellales bacterium]|nr:polysaccharide biosynthesis tyrosine autokinase [Kiritimatiellales bacterium]